jgi:hypothetical protein
MEDKNLLDIPDALRLEHAGVLLSGLCDRSDQLAPGIRQSTVMLYSGVPAMDEADLVMMEESGETLPAYLDDMRRGFRLRVLESDEDHVVASLERADTRDYSYIFSRYADRERALNLDRKHDYEDIIGITTMLLDRPAHSAVIQVVTRGGGLPGSAHHQWLYSAPLLDMEDGRGFWCLQSVWSPMDRRTKAYAQAAIPRLHHWE